MARQRKLSPERKELIQGLISHYKQEDAQDVQAMLRDLLGDTLQQMLEAEMDEHLGYTRYDYKNKKTDDEESFEKPVRLQKDDGF
jgi:transposase-like protein